jgi:predicted amidohydrolase
LEYYGHSRIVSPEGIVIAEGGYKEGLVMASVDIRGEMDKARMITFFGLNLIKDRMPTTYRNIADSSIYYPPLHMAAKTDHSKT